MLKIYHNPRCSKSRKALELLGDREFDVIEYLKNPLLIADIKRILRKMNLHPLDIIRKNEEEFKVLSCDLSDDELVTAMAKFPKIIERPIIETDEIAFIARPPEKIQEIL